MKLDENLEFDDISDSEENEIYHNKSLVVIALSVILCIIVVLILFLVFKKNDMPSENVSTNISSGEVILPEGTVVATVPQDISGAGIDFADVDTDEEIQALISVQQKGAEVGADGIRVAVAENEVAGTTIGIDVAKYQGTIDFEKVADAGIDFVIVRIGYRTAKTGEIIEDVNAAYNLQQAHANGLKLGAYFFSTAITEAEAKEEADFVADFVDRYPITYPIAYNCEGFLDSENRNFGLANSDRTLIAKAFLDEIDARGYTPMFYSSKNEMEDSRYWDMDMLENNYKIWVSQYPETAYPDTPKSSYNGEHAMWQYTNQGSIPGIGQKVDINVAYFGYTSENEAIVDEAPETAAADVEALMNFKDVSERVTAKNSTNLRTEPSTAGDTVVFVLKNGEVADRTGIDEASGWSRIEYNGQVLYAVTSYLTTDLEAKPNANEDSAGGSDMVIVDGVAIKTTFTDMNDLVTAKDLVNLRSLPSVTNESVKVVGTLSEGEVLTRTGINNEYGWSRLEYNGQTVYAISSYLKSAE